MAAAWKASGQEPRPVTPSVHPFAFAWATPARPLGFLQGTPCCESLQQVTSLGWMQSLVGDVRSCGYSYQSTYPTCPEWPLHFSVLCVYIFLCFLGVQCLSPWACVFGVQSSVCRMTERNSFSLISQHCPVITCGDPDCSYWQFWVQGRHIQEMGFLRAMITNRGHALPTLNVLGPPGRVYMIPIFEAGDWGSAVELESEDRSLVLLLILELTLERLLAKVTLGTWFSSKHCSQYNKWKH